MFTKVARRTLALAVLTVTALGVTTTPATAVEPPPEAVPYVEIAPLMCDWRGGRSGNSVFIYNVLCIGGADPVRPEQRFTPAVTGPPQIAVGAWTTGPRSTATRPSGTTFTGHRVCERGRNIPGVGQMPHQCSAWDTRW